MKRNYNRPEVQIAHIALASMVLAGSPGNTMPTFDIEGEQW